ncbi:tyrosine-type recombinase/integrase [Sphingomonas agri]|uniref:tyrosine-type recombinase/integrase n=1 Tax=Sphingomonas agri TaxID=1813878 RepID=UPI00311EA909
MADLSRVKDRETLKPRREPYWQRLRPGCFVGFRAATRGGAGTWIARAYDETKRCYRLKALGSFGEKPANERFAAAKKEAESFATEVERGSISEEKVETVEDACRRFAKSRDEAAGRFSRYVYSDPIAKVKLAKLRRSHVAAWRARLEATPALVSRRKKGEPITRPRSPATLNRDMAVLRTALGAVLPLGAPNTESAWQEPLKPVKNAVKRRTLYLNRDQRRKLVGAVDSEAEPFVRALCLLPLRPGAVAALTAGDFDKRTSELTIGKDKAGDGRRIIIPTVAASLFIATGKNKLPAATLFTRANGKAWDKETWNDAIGKAATAAKLPPNVTAYTLRHSTITDLVTAGLPLLTIAQISGTSAEMIERHYGHLVRDAATEALAGLAL